MKIPKTIGACADLLYETKRKRLALQKQVEALEAEENALKEHIIATLPKSDASGVAGKLARVTVTSKEVPVVKDWPAFYKYILKHKSFDLLQRRLSDAAVKSRIEDGERLPGVETFNAKLVNLNKL